MSEAIDLAAYNDAVGRVRELLNRWIESGLDLFLELRKIELSGDWKAPGHAGFQDFLSREFPHALGIERYNNVIQALEIHGEDFVRRMGVHGCHAVTVKPVAENPRAAELVRASVLQHLEQHRCPPEQAELRKIVRGVVGEPARPASSTRAVTALVKAQETIRELREKLRESEAECERLRKRLAKVEAQAGTARKPVRNGAKSHGRNGRGVSA